eukprot:jgi/Phyca11/19803/fgenesh1_pg.PHYCAscaffold_52_\
MAENVQTAAVKTLGNMAVMGAATLANATTMTDDAVGDAVGTSSSGVLTMSVRTVIAASEAAVEASNSTAAADDKALPDVPLHGGGSDADGRRNDGKYGNGQYDDEAEHYYYEDGEYFGANNDSGDVDGFYGYDWYTGRCNDWDGNGEAPAAEKTRETPTNNTGDSATMQCAY